MNANSTMDEIRVVLENTNSDNGWLSSLTTCLITIISGVVVFIIGQYLFSMWIQPLQEYKKIRSKIAFCLTYYAQYYSNVKIVSDQDSEYNLGSDDIRKLASELRGFSETISFIHFGIPKKEKIFEASKKLIGLSNSFYAAKGCEQVTIQQNLDSAKKIKMILNMTDES